MAKKTNTSEGRMQVSVRQGTYDALTELSKRNGLSISETISVAVTRYGEAMVAMDARLDMFDRMNRLIELLEETIDGKN